MKNITTMTIKGFGATCVVLKAREPFTPVPNKRSEPRTMSIASICLDYDDGSKMSFYIEEESLINFIRESVNRNNFRTHDGQLTHGMI